MAGENTATSLDSLFHEVFLKGEAGIVNVVPQVDKMQRLIELDESLNPGDYFKQMIEVAAETGVTYAGPDEDVVALNAAEASESKEAQVKPHQMFLRSVLGYNAADKASQGGEKSFRDATQHMVLNMLRTIRKRVEVDLIRGQSHIGKVSAVAGQVITIDPDFWAPGIWYGSKNVFLDVFAADDSTLQQGGLKVSSVNMATRQVTLVGAMAGIGAGSLLYFKGQNAAGTKKSMTGLDTIATHTGTLHNIPTGSYPDVWKGQTKAIAGNLTMQKLLEMADQSGVAGCEENTVALIPHRAFTKLNMDQSALRDYDGSYKEGEAKNGVRSIKYVGQMGTIDIVSHPYVMESECYLFAPDNFKRIGREIGFTRPGPGGGGDQGKIFRELADNTGFELRCWTKQTLYTPNPAWVVKGTGITYV